jgi:hypothetical protein
MSVICWLQRREIPLSASRRGVSGYSMKIWPYG